MKLSPKMKLLIGFAAGFLGAVIITVVVLLVVSKTNVTKLNTLGFESATASVNVGESITISLTSSPDNAKNKTIKYSVSDASVATIVSHSNYSVTLMATKRGTITLTALSEGNKKLSDTCSIIVSDTLINSISTDNDSYSVFVGDTLTIPLNYGPNDATVSSIKIKNFDSSKIESAQIETTKTNDITNVNLIVVAKTEGISIVSVGVYVQTDAGECNIISKDIIIDARNTSVQELTTSLVSGAGVNFRYQNWKGESYHNNKILLYDDYYVYMKAFALFEGESSNEEVSDNVVFDYDSNLLKVERLSVLNDVSGDLVDVVKISALSAFFTGNSRTVLKISYLDKEKNIDIFYFEKDYMGSFEISYDDVFVGENATPTFVFKNIDDVVVSNANLNIEFILNNLFVPSWNGNSNIIISQKGIASSYISDNYNITCSMTSGQFIFWDDNFALWKTRTYDSVISVKDVEASSFSVNEFSKTISGSESTYTIKNEDILTCEIVTGGTAYFDIVIQPFGAGYTNITFNILENSTLITTSTENEKYTISAGETTGTAKVQVTMTLSNGRELSKIIFITIRAGA